MDGRAWCSNCLRRPATVHSEKYPVSLCATCCRSITKRLDDELRRERDESFAGETVMSARRSD